MAKCTILFRKHYIAFEGIDGCGKDTQLTLLKEFLEKGGESVLTVAEPDETNSVGQFLRSCLKSGDFREAHAALFLADRIILTDRTVIPALKEGKVVLSSRSFLSTIAYQQRMWSKEWLETIHQALPIKPGLIILFDISPYLAMERMKVRGGTPEVYETRETLIRVRKAYLEYAEAHKNEVMVIDASGTPKEVWVDVYNKLLDRGYLVGRRMENSDEESVEASTEDCTKTSGEGETAEG